MWIINVLQKILYISLEDFNEKMFHIAINVSTSFSSSSFREPSSHICALVSFPDRRATAGSSVTSSTRSMSSPCSLGNGGIYSREAAWNRFVSAMSFVPISSPQSRHPHKAFILILIKVTCSSSFSNAIVFQKSFEAHANVVPTIKVTRRTFFANRMCSSMLQ